MAINKRKVLDAARKYAQKGAKQKALKEYNRLLDLDPRDAKLLLEVGDAYRRWGQTEEAIAQYTKVAGQYKQDGFDARAVAVYKQILNLDPKRLPAFVALSELYQRMGLDSEAIGALQTAADGYHKEGRKREALDLLRRMATLDPSNTTSRMKVADLLHQEGMSDDAAVEFEAVAEELKRQGATDQLAPVYERILQIKPERANVAIALARNLADNGKADRAVPHVVRALQTAPEPDNYELLCSLYQELGNDEKYAEATRELARAYRERGDDDKARQILQRLPSEGASVGIGGPDVSEAAPPLLGDDELLDDDPFLAVESGDGALGGDDDGLDFGGDDIEIDAGTDVLADAPAPKAAAAPPRKPAAAPAAAAAAAPPVPEGDPDQLLAEASVYIRYGKTDQAITSLQGILAQEPGHRGAHEKLGEAYAELEYTDEAVSHWKQAAEIARAENDVDGFESILERIANVDPMAISDIERMGSADPEPAADDGFEVDVDVDVDMSGDDDGGIDLDVDVELSDVMAEAAASVDPEVADEDFGGDDLASDDGGFEIDIDSDGELAFGDDDTQEDDTASVSDDGGFEIDVDDGAAASAGPGHPGGSSHGPERVAEELEEAEFYFGQDLYDEAEAIYRRVLVMAPNHPQAMLRLGEIEAARGASAAPAPAGPSSEVGKDTTAVAEVGPEEDFDEPGGMSAQDLLAGTGVMDEPPPPAKRTDDTLPFGDECGALGGDGDSFDLAAELADALADDGADAASDDSSRSTVDDGFESVFADFKKGVSAALDEGDYETRYDLGIAYREMGLHDDAINEFRHCLQSDARRFDSLYMMGLCARDAGRYADAINHLEQALSSGDVPEPRLAGVFFDVGVAHEAQGDVDRALDAYRRAHFLDSELPGVTERIEALESGEAPSAELATPDAYESFDDLFSDGGGQPKEAFESFDDVITEAEVIADAESAEEDGPTDPGASSSGRSGRGGKKKISFV